MEDLKNPLVQDQSTQEIEKAISEDQNAIPYSPMSKLVSMGTVIPLSLAGETMQAQYSVMEDIPDIDAYLVEKLGYSSKYALSQAFSAEQADAVAMAIRQIENGKGFILADMAGIGKGRVNAGVLRFAYVNDYLPIFITEKPNLFSALYRDLIDIGGLETKVGGKPNLGYPLILNGFQKGETVKTIDENGKRVKITKPSVTGILNPDGKEVITAPSQEEIKKIIKKDVLPKAYDYMMLTYSQLSAKDSGKLKAEYILEVIKSRKFKVVLCIDECHNAAGVKSSVGREMSNIVSSVQGVLFSSATFSKRPDNMFIYALKTDIADSPIGVKGLIEVIEAGGERLTENLASSLVESQQMLRRERTFENCNVEYNYMRDDQKEELFTKYDNAVNLFSKIEEFFSDSVFIEAKKTILNRIALKYKITVSDSPKPQVKGKGSGDIIKEWAKQNEGKYAVEFTAGELPSSNKFMFIEALLFALKAEFVSNQTLSQLLNNKLKNLTITKEEFESNRKPVIAVRNTLESVYYNLGYQVGDVIEDPDFSLYIKSLMVGCMSGYVKLKQITISYDGKVKYGKVIKSEVDVQDSDFSDNGEAYNKLISKIDNINLGIPLSPIDHIINKIESTPRPQWDMQHGLGTKTFQVGEVTGRSLNLIPVTVILKNGSVRKIEGNAVQLLEGEKYGSFRIETNKKPKNKSTTFKNFNSGIYDVLLINESGSTGEDAHSSSRFKDQRPRVMIIHQVELDVNTEVQKRGRINRTGMVNYPNYIYAISRIPSEIRRLLMLVRKLRSLDANTTANQKQSAKLSQIRDAKGNEILDVINKYGDEVLDEFLSVPAHDEYLQYADTDEQGKLARVDGKFAIEGFIKNLDTALSEKQEKFYNIINELYAALKKKKEDDNEYDLETNIVDLKAQIKTRVVVNKGQNTSPFNTSVYEEDDYVLSQDKPYNRDKVESLIKELSKGKVGKEADEFYDDFVTDYKNNFLLHIKDVENAIKVPDYDSAKDDMQRMQLEAEYELKVRDAKNKAFYEYHAVLDVLEAKYGRSDGSALIFHPDRPVLIPEVIDDCYEVDKKGNPIPPLGFNNAKFVGIRLLKIADYKYSPMNIEMVFCQLNGKPRFTLKPTIKGRQVFFHIIAQTRKISTPSLQLINNWQVDSGKRNIIRLLTGNILGAYGIAKDTVTRNPTEYSQVIEFVKFTTADGTSIRLGIKLNMKRFIALRPDVIPIQYQLNSKDLIKDLINYNDTGISVKTSNINQDFGFEYIVNTKQLKICIFGGLYGKIEKKPRFVSQLYQNGVLVQFLDTIGVRYDATDTVLYQPIGQKNEKKLNCLSISLNLAIDADNVQKIFDYIYNYEPFNVSLRGVESEETLYNERDIPEDVLKKLLKNKDDDDDIEGEFKYNSVERYENIKNSIENFSKFDKFIKTSNYGTIYLKKRANIREVISYGLIPLDNTINDMVSDTFQVLTSDTERIKLNTDIGKVISKGGDDDKIDFEIGVIVENALRNKSNLEYIFGKDSDIFFIGEVFRAYYKGDIIIPEKKKKQDDEQQEERQEIPLNIETAQQFMILFTYKVKN